MALRPEEIELLEGELGYVCNGKLCISPCEIGIDLVLLRIGETKASAEEARVKIGHPVKVKADGHFEVNLLDIREGSFDDRIPPSATFSITKI